MHQTLNPKPADDPHDILVVGPGAAVMVPTDEELSKLARSLRNSPSPQQSPTGADLSPAATVPPVDTTFRPTAVGDIRGLGRPTAIGKAARAFAAALLLAACAGAASISWQSYGDAAGAMIARWAPQRVLAWLPLEKPAPVAQPAPPAVPANVANADPAQAGGIAPNPAEDAAPAVPAAPPDAPQSLDSMANQLASARQEIEQLKASIEELKAGQQQMARDLVKASDSKAADARASDPRTSEIKASPDVRASEARMPEVRPAEQNLRPRTPAHPPRTTIGRVPHKPVPIPPPPLQQTATAPMPPASARYVPRPMAPPPQTTGETLTDPELASVPRPPMPVRRDPF
jgi:hypothetical protein